MVQDGVVQLVEMGEVLGRGGVLGHSWRGVTGGGGRRYSLSRGGRKSEENLSKSCFKVGEEGGGGVGEDAGWGILMFCRNLVIVHVIGLGGAGFHDAKITTKACTVLCERKTS